MKRYKLPLFVLIAICLFGCKKNSVKSIIDPDPQPKFTPTIVILGSSTAEGTGATPIDSSWANRLASTVNKSETKAHFINLAFGGYTTYQGMPSGFAAASRPAPDTARNITKALSLHPALVLLSYPTNDIAANYTDDEIIKNYAKIVHVLDSAKISYIIFSTQPRDFTDVNERMRLKTLNDKIKVIYGYHINDFLDQLSTATYSIKPEYEAGDGIHVNNAGHAIIYNATLAQPIFITTIGGVPK